MHWISSDPKGPPKQGPKEDLQIELSCLISRRFSDLQHPRQHDVWYMFAAE